MPRWTSQVTLALVLALPLTACTDGRLRKLSAGIDRDSVAVIMEADAPTSGTSYLTNGQQWEVLLYARKAPDGTDTLPWRKMSPVVMADGKVVGWGWNFLDQTAERFGFAVPPKE